MSRRYRSERYDNKMGRFVLRHLDEKPKPVYVAPWGAHGWIVTLKNIADRKLVGYFTVKVDPADFEEAIEYVKAGN